VQSPVEELDPLPDRAGRSFLLEDERSPQSVLRLDFGPSARADALLRQCALPFDKATHEPLLRQLWQSAFPALPFERVSSRWEELGFQSDDPVTDLRGVGLTGLMHLAHFCSTNGNLEIVRGSHSAFPLATASLNVTHILCAHLGLLASPAGGAGKVELCSKDVQHNFIRLHAATSTDGEPGVGPSFLDLMHEQLLRWLFDRWVELDSSTPPGPRLMQMPRLLCMLRDHLRGTLSAASTPWSVPALLVALRQDDLNNKTWLYLQRRAFRRSRVISNVSGCSVC